jgi:hypothetical protein
MDRSEERVGHVLEDEADAGGAAVGSSQCAGREVAPVAQQLDRFPHALTEVGANGSMAVTTREIVLRLTPAKAATSCIVGRRRSPGA